MIDKTGSASSIVKVPYEKVYGEGFEDLERRAANTSKLAQAIGFKCETSLDRTLDRMIAFAQVAVRS